jgi:hypothetical protein
VNARELRRLCHVLLGTRTHLSLNKDAPISRLPRQPDAHYLVARSWVGFTTNMPGFDLR